MAVSTSLSDKPAAQQGDAGPLQGIQRPGFGCVQQPQCRVERAGLLPGLRRHQRTLGTPIWVGGQYNRAFEERGCGRQAPACLCTARLAFEFGGNVRIWS